MVIAGPNLTIDRTLTIDELRPGEVLRFDGVAVTPGGKGVNVARVARALGAPAVLVGFAPGRTGAAAAELIADEGLELEPGPGRRRAALHGGRAGAQRAGHGHERAGAGDRPRRTGSATRRPSPRRLEGHAVLVCSGSVPPGAPPDAYGRLVELAARSRAAAIVDARRGSARRRAASGPDVVCPNLAEAEGLLHGRADETVEAGDPGEVRARAARGGGRARPARGTRRGRHRRRGGCGGGGRATTVSWHAGRAVTVRNPIGAGDALVGGLAAALERGEPLEDAVAAGMATRRGERRDGHGR